MAVHALQRIQTTILSSKQIADKSKLSINCLGVRLVLFRKAEAKFPATRGLKRSLMARRDRVGLMRFSRMLKIAGQVIAELKAEDWAVLRTFLIVKGVDSVIVRYVKTR